MSYFLFVNSSRLFGFARTLDLFAVFDDYNISLNPAQADWLALQDDAAKVYQDFWQAYTEHTENIELQNGNGDGQHVEPETAEISLAR